MSVNRCYSEKKNGFDVEARSLFSSLHDLLEIKNLTHVRYLCRYDAEGLAPETYEKAKGIVFSEPMADVNLDYPQAEIAVMGAEGAVNILYRKSTPEEKQEIIKEYENKFSNPYRAAERGLIDEVIMPRDTRYKLAQALDMCHNKNQSNPPKKHGNMPL